MIVYLTSRCREFFFYECVCFCVCLFFVCLTVFIIVPFILSTACVCVCACVRVRACVYFAAGITATLHTQHRTLSRNLHQCRKAAQQQTPRQGKKLLQGRKLLQHRQMQSLLYQVNQASGVQRPPLQEQSRYRE